MHALCVSVVCRANVSLRRFGPFGLVDESQSQHEDLQFGSVLVPAEGFRFWGTKMLVWLSDLLSSSVDC